MHKCSQGLPSSLARSLLPQMEQAALLQYTFVTGFILGGFSAAQRASVQFLAEHQHETLRKRSEFVAFHRARNYRLMAAFGTGGVRRGAQLAAVAAAYLATKEGINWMRMRGRLAFPVFLDNLIACSVLGGAVFAVGSNYPKFYHFRRGVVLGSLLGLTISSLQVAKTVLE